MRISIDNMDGAGARDYTGAVAIEGRVRLERTLNAPSRCVFEVLEGALPLPARRGRVVVTEEDGSGTVLFTGYIATEPVRVYVGVASEGTVYRARVTAISDEWLLDRASAGSAPHGAMSLALDGRSLLARLTLRAQNGAGSITVAEGSSARAVNAFASSSTAPWSVNAGRAASAAYAGYRALAGQVLLQPGGAVTHAFSDADGTLDVRALSTGNLRQLANDITVSGEEEPAAMVSEIFVGDGATTAFTLSEAPLRGRATTLIDDSFEGSTFDPVTWSVADPGSHLSLTSAGVTFAGGTGFDGQTTLGALDAVEMGGTLLFELSGVVLGAGSDGMLAGLYTGSPVLAECFAGFRVRQTSSGTGGVTMLAPVLNAAEVGATFTPMAGHRYTLRLRLHCVEMYRLRQLYYAMSDGVVESFGSAGGIDAPMHAVFEVVDEGAASNTPATVLYDTAAAGAVAATPATCAFVAVNATSLFGSVSRVRVTRPGSVWVTSTPPSGTPQTRLMGVAGEGVDCQAQYGATAKVTFFDGRVPVAGERVVVQYRRQQRSVARLADAASVAAEALAGAGGTCRWLGKVEQPVARTSVDCESAAQALLAVATSRTAAVSGTYVAENLPDIWPGDVLQVTSEGVSSALLVRSVTLQDAGAVPELVTAHIVFANDWATGWADGLGVRVSEAIADDAELPQQAAQAAGQALESLQSLRVTSLSSAVLQLDAGMTAPVGGGFEVRRRDAAWGPSSDGDLVLRSPVQNLSIPRAAQLERYFVRCYDASSPPLYSRFSAAVFVNAPVG